MITAASKTLELWNFCVTVAQCVDVAVKARNSPLGTKLLVALTRFIAITLRKLTLYERRDVMLQTMSKSPTASCLTCVLYPGDCYCISQY
jgi:hypothetical protein